MNHPSHEQWGLYVFGEAAPDLHRNLKCHLDQCEQCAGEVAAMQNTLGKLDSWQIPAGPGRAPRREPVLRFAMAAAIVLALGIGFGRFTAPKAPDAAQLRAELQASWMADFDAALARNAAIASNLVATAEFRLAQQTEGALQSWGRQVFEAVNMGREQDRGAIQTVLDQYKRDRESDYVSLRRDLETVASSADQEIRRAQLKLFEIAATTNSNP